MRNGPEQYSSKEAAAGSNLSKLLPLEDAISRYIRPGMTVHLAAGIGGPSAALCELIRQFRETRPDFTIVQSTISGHALNLVHCGLVKELICAACIDISDSARPSKIIQRALAASEIELSNWSLCSLQQRLMAAAFGFPFIPTRSVTGSNIAGDHPDSFKMLEDPFDTANTFGVVKALHPDISIIHACMGDEAGNLILSAPYGDDIWGSLASTEGIIATVESIVSADVVRKYAALVKIPGYLVKSVSVAPFGAHPFSFTNPGVDDFAAYEKDTEFLKLLHKASSSRTSLDEWVKTWVEDCADHEQYLKRIGRERLDALKYRKTEKDETTLSANSVTPSEIAREATDEEMMLITVAREVNKSVRKNEHRTILAGAGAGATAAWMAYYQLRDDGYEVELITGNGLIGYSPLPGASVLSSEAGVRTAKMLTDTVTTHGVLVGGKNSRCLSVLGAGQIDRFGNINSTKTSSGAFLVGSGGGNDAVNAREVIVTLKQSKDRFAETLPFITGRGDAVTTVVSTMGVFRKGEDGTLCLQSCFPGKWAPTLEEKIQVIQEHCGWSLTFDQVDEVAPPAPEEVELLRWLLASETE